MIVKFSYFILFALLFAVIINSVYIDKVMNDIYDISERSGEGAEELNESFDKINRIYEKNEIFISLTVSHEDLTELELILAEINGALAVGDADEARIAKSRFENAVLHLARLSGVNIESIL
jgi:hypothetical protein